jgi:hypothetical protein
LPGLDPGFPSAAGAQSGSARIIHERLSQAREKQGAAPGITFDKQPLARIIHENFLQTHENQHVAPDFARNQNPPGHGGTRTGL